MGAYVFDNSWERERMRLAGIESMLDPGTRRHLDAVGVSAGWRCLEVGGGGGSIVQWLCRRVGQSGSVVATDLDTRFLDALEEPNLPPRMFRYAGDGTRPSLRVWQGVVNVMKQAGYDGEFGYRLPGEFLSLGLNDVGGEVRAPIFRGGSPSTAAHRFTLEHLRGSLLELGISEDELVREIAALDDPRMLFSLPSILMAAWARRPETARAKAAGAMPERRETTVDRLRHVPLLEACTAEELNRIATLVEEIEVPAGEVLTHEGAREALFYLVATGTATVTREGHRLTTLGPGAFFGEVALLTHGPRTATVTADTAMKLLRLDERRFTALLTDAPSVSRKILEGVAKRLAT